MFNSLFLSHPRSVGESYIEHMGVAARFGGTMVLAGIAVLIHALVPALFTRTGSLAIKRLYGEMKRRQPLLSDEPPSFRSPSWQLEYEI